MLVGWRLAQATLEETTIGRVSFEVGPSLTGRAEAFVPVADWGFRADAFDAPFELRAELRSLNRGALLRAAEGERAVLDATEEELADAARAAILRSFAWGAGVALLLLAIATALWRSLRPRWALLAIGAPALAIGVAVTLWRADASFDAAAFDSPTYFARGNELSRILEVAEQERIRSPYGSEFASILRSISTVLATEDSPDPAGVDVYLGSDLHGNALVVEPLSRLIGDSPLLLAGDFGQRGGEAEAALLAPRFSALGSEIVAVSGNHDTDRLMRRLSREGMTVLTDQGRLSPEGEVVPPPVIHVEGLLVAGFPDPLEYRGEEPDAEDRVVGLDQIPDAERVVAEWEADLLAWFRGLPRAPDLVLVHQDRLAQALAESLWRDGYDAPLVIATGDDHRQHVDRYGSILVVNGGTLGAGGVFGAGTQAIGFAHLHLDRAGSLRSVDLIAVEPFSGSAQARRIVAQTLCPETQRCTVGSSEIEAVGARPAG